MPAYLPAAASRASKLKPGLFVGAGSVCLQDGNVFLTWTHPIFLTAPVSKPNEPGPEAEGQVDVGQHGTHHGGPHAQGVTGEEGHPKKNRFRRTRARVPKLLR